MDKQCQCQTCGYKWQHGADGSHSCTDELRVALTKALERAHRAEDFIAYNLWGHAQKQKGIAVGLSWYDLPASVKADALRDAWNLIATWTIGQSLLSTRMHATNDHQLEQLIQQALERATNHGS